MNSLLGSFRHYAPQLAAADQPDFTQALDVSIARNTQLARFRGRLRPAGAPARARPAPPRPAPTCCATSATCWPPKAPRQGVAWHWELAHAGPLPSWPTRS
ncbi:MAG: hypothetical protein WKG07_38730 [Hymenobacter sp.]